MQTILLYSCDMWLTTCSRVLLAVCTDKETAVKIATDAAGYTDEPLTGEQQSELLNNYQTFGRNENFMIEAVTLNEII